ncbi:MAG: hypothetical protein AB1344_06840 [Pseudomonadota bacterium]
MPNLSASLNTLDAPDFNRVLLDDLMRQGALARPLQQGLRYGSVALLEDVKLGIFECEMSDAALRIKVGVYYSSIITGCNCIDDPSPLSEMPEYVELFIDIDRATAGARVSLAPD